MALPSPIVGVHLDLKYPISSKTYLLDWVRDLPSMGVNTLLIEYEDKFPFRKHPYIRANGAFTPRELRQFLTVARQSGLTIIPLVQTLSHLEFALGHPELAHLREMPDTPTQVDTSNPQAIDFIKTLLDEVLEYHQEDELFHLGADETWHLGHNERTAPVKEKLGLVDMWAQHTMQFVRHIKAAGKQPIVWDDIFWKATPEEIKSCQLDRDVLLHCWSYGSTDNEKSLAGLANRVGQYHDAGFQTIAAPCFNWGVATPRQEHCLRNTHGWAITIPRLGMKGIINTAWSCFHALPHTQNLQIAAMGEMMRNPGQLPSNDWQDQFMSQRLGCDAAGYAQAMSDIEGFWELDAGLERPITVILYGCMDMVLWYGNQAIRAKQGAYSWNLGDVNFDEIFRRKLAHMIRLDKPDGQVSAKLAQLRDTLATGLATMRDIAARASRHNAEIDFMVWIAAIKHHHADILLDVLAGRPVCSRKAALWGRLGLQGVEVLKPLVEPLNIWRLIDMWWKPLATTFTMAPIPRSPEA